MSSETRSKILDLVRVYASELKANENKFSPGDKVNYAGRVYDEAELLNLVDSSLDFWLTAGKYAAAFEKNLAEFTGSRFCSMVNSGSSANLLAFAALCSHKLGKKRICKGDEVITTASCFPTTVAPIIQNGAIPVFIDIELPSCNADISLLEAALSSRTKAVFLTHTLGNPFKVEELRSFCKEHDLWLIEDNCDALGSRYLSDGRWSQTGTAGDISTSSFYPAHHITTGEGGAVFTDNPLLHTIVRSLRDWGRDCSCESGQDGVCGHRFSRQFGSLPNGYDHKYVYSHLGYNLKATEMQASIGCAQLQKLPDFIKKRKENWSFFREKLAPYGDYFILPDHDREADPSWFGFMLILKPESGLERKGIVQFLEQNKIQTRMLFAGNIIRHPCFEELAEGREFRVSGSLERTDFIMNNAFWIGVYPGLSVDQREYVAKNIIDYISISKK